MSRKAKGTVLVALGLVMVLAATAMYAMYERRDARAGQNAEKLLYELSIKIENRASAPDAYKSAVNIGRVDPSEDAGQTGSEDGAEEEVVHPDMETADYYGLAAIGIIRVPSCGIELPVLYDWDYTILDYAPCRYTGNIYAGDLVIMGHNYWSHFKPLKNVEIGADVEFVDVNGAVWRYTVDEIDSIHKNDVDALPSEHELILFTCEEYGVYRFVARCSLVEVIYPQAESE